MADTSTTGTAPGHPRLSLIVVFLLPIFAAIGGVVGFFYNAWSVQSDAREKITEFQQNQILEIIKFHASLEPTNVNLANIYIGILADNSALPQSVLCTLMSIGSSKKAGAASADAFFISNRSHIANCQKDTQLAIPQPPPTSAGGASARLYVQLSNKGQEGPARAATQKVATDLVSPKVAVPDFEITQNYVGPTTLRYFFGNDAADAKKICQALAESYPGIKLFSVAGYSASKGVTPGLFELWVGPPAAAVDASSKDSC
jgi:hypothetical protein